MPKPPTTPGKPGKYKPETVVDPMVNGITILGIFEKFDFTQTDHFRDRRVTGCQEDSFSYS